MIQIHHHECLNTEEDCDEMKFFSASIQPQFKNNQPVYVFSKIREPTGIFRPNSQIGEIYLKHFCLINLCRKMKRSKRNGIALTVALVIEPFNAGNFTYYSARLYRSRPSTDYLIASAVFCVCPHHPLYIKVRVQYCAISAYINFQIIFLALR